MSSGTAKPILFRYSTSRGSSGSSAFLRMCLPSPPLSLTALGRLDSPFDELVVEERRAHFEAVRHAGAIDLRQDVARQVGLVVQVLHQRERIAERLAAHVPWNTSRGAIALQLALERSARTALRASRRSRSRRRGSTPSTVSRASAWNVVLPRSTRGAQSSFGYSEPSGPNTALRRRERQAAAHPLFHREQLVAAIADEVLVAAVARQRDGHVPARELDTRDRSESRSCPHTARRRCRRACSSSA